ncbi:sialidase family protein [Brachyspira sp.]|uniref:sialidase family protein n=1 Tax=Brachyspira sp. TaxID=1977261 RepID=UPI003D7D2140
MRKRYFFIPLAVIIIITGIYIWACKHPWGTGIGDVKNEGGAVGGWTWTQNEKGLGFTGEMTYNPKGPAGQGMIPSSRAAGYGGSNVFPRNNGNNYYRIPTLVVAKNGDILAFSDKRKGGAGDVPNHPIETVMRRSTDNGTNWGPETLVSPTSPSKDLSYGDGAYILDRETGNIICMVVGDAGFLTTDRNKYPKIRLIIGKNNGHNWSEPIDITDEIYGPNCKNPERQQWYAAFVTAGNGVQLKDGRMLFVLNVRPSSATSLQSIRNYALYSDDGGNSWKVSKTAPQTSVGGSESHIVELSNGDLLMSTRPNSGGKRYLAKSKDRGENWEAAYPQNDFNSSPSNGDIIYYTSTANGWDKNRIISLAGAKSGSPGEPTLSISYDDGNTWKQKLAGQASGYCSIAILPDGSIGMLYESGGPYAGPIAFMRTSLEWAFNDTATKTK